MSESIKHLSLTYYNADSHASALKLILALKPEWEATQQTVEFVRFKDGITNTLFKAINRLPGLSEQEIDREAVLLRAYGNGTDVLIDRERETQSHSLLASHNLAPPLLARFENGLLYKFIEGTPCAPEDLRRPEVWKAVARRLAEWHATLPIAGISSIPPSTGDNGRPHHSRKASLDAIEGVTPGKPIPNVWTVMQKWIYALPRGNPAQVERVERLQKELRWLVQLLGDTPGIDGRPLVFSHCDLLSGNVIIHPPQSSKESSRSSQSDVSEESPCVVSFIDYEYATPAPAAFDIANHFAEWGGFDCDFSVLPTRSQRRNFLEEYLASYYSRLDRQGGEEELTQLFNEVEMFRGVPGFYWGIWALIQAQISQIEFDYASYAETRLGEYWAWKADFEGTRPAGEEMPLRERRWAQEE